MWAVRLAAGQWGSLLALLLVGDVLLPFADIALGLEVSALSWVHLGTIPLNLPLLAEGEEENDDYEEDDLDEEVIDDEDDDDDDLEGEEEEDGLDDEVSLLLPHTARWLPHLSLNVLNSLGRCHS